MSAEEYKTIAASAEGAIREKGSRFLGYCWPVQNVEEAEAHLAATRKKYFDATHVCYAVRLGHGGDITRANDDGEPAHSAGDPILAEIRSRDLTYILIAVVRYFGGTKLGVGGLIQSYRAAAATAIDAAEIITIVPVEQLKISFTYPQTSEVNRLIHQFNLRVAATEFDADCVMILEARVSDIDTVSEKLRNLGIFIEE